MPPDQGITSSHRLLFEAIDQLRDQLDDAIATQHPDGAAALLEAIRALLCHLDKLASQRIDGAQASFTCSSPAKYH